MARNSGLLPCKTGELALSITFFLFMSIILIDSYLGRINELNVPLQ